LAQAFQEAISGVQRKVPAPSPKGQEVLSENRWKQQSEFTKPLQNPQGAVVIQSVTLRQFPSPRIVDHNDGSEFRGLDDGLNFAQVFTAFGVPLGP
jgi:hypothetical protein